MSGNDFYAENDKRMRSENLTIKKNELKDFIKKDEIFSMYMKKKSLFLKTVNAYYK